MSKNHRENRKPACADWIVVHIDHSGMRGQVNITEAAFTRDEHGGYTFTGKAGVTADFPPGAVLHVMRVPEASPAGTWPPILPAAAQEVLDSRA